MERPHLTHTEESYGVTDSYFNVDELKDKLLDWERVYNTFRPHQSLGYLTPKELLECYKQNDKKEVMCP
jgi:transposase InsO family protein